MPNARDRLRAIKTFKDLICYLEEELGWPLLDQYGFEELTFEYSPEELGLREQDVAKVKAVHQLRPLQQGQPWGIFFVEFESKRMPIVVLRRILSHLVVKRRASASKAKAPTWHLDDLLFISAFGDEATDQREIAFAHFHQEAGDLPTLRVLGWDGADTPLKLDHVAAVLHERLRWPDDPDDADAWRRQWAPAFRHRPGHIIRTADALADRLAALARGIRDAATTLMAHEMEQGPLRQLHKAFQIALIHDLSEAGFADTYAQTITYGLLTAAISRTDKDAAEKGTDLIASNLTDMVPITNPFLREMLGTFLQVGGRRGGIDFDELGIQDVVDLLRGEDTDLPAILRDFGNRTQGEDPVVHFYEDFLKAYNRRLKIRRGVFYTPQPVVSYIVRSVHEVLQNEFGLEDGLASTATWAEMARRHRGLAVPDGTDPQSPFVVILDPATGTATFLVEVIDLIYRTLTAKWNKQRLSHAEQQAAWNEYVPNHLLPRLYGYELMMAPYAIAHMKIGLKLHETGYRFASDQRVRIYLSNSLEPPEDFSDRFAFMTPALAHEAEAVNHVKSRQRFTVLVGNPPYSGQSANQGEWIRTLVRDYYFVDGQPLGERNPKWLQDDYVKFLRLCQHELTRSRCGVVGLITNHAYLDNPTFRGFRRSLLDTFGDMTFIDLHGNYKKAEQHPDGSRDVNVFDIQQGVAICILTKTHRTHENHTRHTDVYGARESKYALLAHDSLQTTRVVRIHPVEPFYLFIPQDDSLRSEYRAYVKMTDAMPVHSNGVVTGRDHLCISWSADEAWRKVREFVSLPPERARALFELGNDSRDWQVRLAQQDLEEDGPRSDAIVPIYYRPFDVRWTYYTGRSRGFLCMPRRHTMGNMLRPGNLALITSRMTKGETFQHAQIARTISEAIVMSPKTSNNGFLFPLYLRPEGDQPSLLSQVQPGNAQVNLSPAFLAALTTGLNRGTGDARARVSGVDPHDILHYVYAVLYSPGYRSRYADFLKIDFPRLPLPGSLLLFRGLARFGQELVDLHLMESPKLDELLTSYIGPPQPGVGRISYSAETVWLDKAHTRGFHGVPQAVWEFHIGGYQVCEKWLKDRRGRTLSPEDLEHYQRIIVAVAETIRLMQEIDQVIDQHGGWPEAFSAPSADEGA